MYISYDSTPIRKSPLALKELMEDIERSQARLERLHQENLELGITDENQNQEYKRLRQKVCDMLDLHQSFMGELNTSEAIHSLTDKQLVTVFQKTIKLIENQVRTGELKEWKLNEVKTILEKYE